jgi:4-hydroxy-3-methylbut-2-en-1-yl diphosphate synthase IspG/GcpE
VCPTSLPLAKGTLLGGECAARMHLIHHDSAPCQWSMLSACCGRVTFEVNAEAGEGEDGRMKSAIGIGSLLLDGLGDTIRVSLTEDPELELEPCRRLANLGATAATEGWGVEPFGETTRDTHSFYRRHGALPEQLDSDGEIDYRNVLHRCVVVSACVHACLLAHSLARTHTVLQSACCRLLLRRLVATSCLAVCLLVLFSACYVKRPCHAAMLELLRPRSPP